jgi:hypothetical protein
MDASKAKKEASEIKKVSFGGDHHFHTNVPVDKQMDNTYVDLSLSRVILLKMYEPAMHVS